MLLGVGLLALLAPVSAQSQRQILPMGFLRPETNITVKLMDDLQLPAITAQQQQALPPAPISPTEYQPPVLRTRPPVQNSVPAAVLSCVSVPQPTAPVPFLSPRRSVRVCGASCQVLPAYVRWAIDNVALHAGVVSIPPGVISMRRSTPPQPPAGRNPDRRDDNGLHVDPSVC